jgi:hypothetical protein
MPTFRYNPGPDEPEVIRTQGRTVKAGEPFELPDDDPMVRKFRGHPQFQERGAEDDRESFDQQQAQLNADARDQLADNRKKVGEARSRAQQELAKAEADERRLALSERAMGSLSPAEIRAMEQVRGVAGEEPPPVPGEPGYQAQSTRGDGVTGGGRVERQGAGGAIEPDNQAKSENAAQQ